MNWEEYQELSTKWCEAREKSAEIRNRFLKSDSEEVASVTSDFEQIEEIIELLKKANEDGETDIFRKLFPPAHDLFVSKFEELEKAISTVVLTEDGTIVFRKGNETKEGCLYYRKDGRITMIPGAKFAGISRDKQFVAIAYTKEIYVYTKDGKHAQTFQWPPEAERNPNIYHVKNMIPFRRGIRVLLVTYGGIFILCNDGYTQRIHPEDDEKYLDMVHGDVSPRDGFIVVGNQFTDHIVLDADCNYEESEVVEVEMSYADFALFNGDGSYVIMNSCHMYDGASVILGMDTDDITDVEVSARLTAGASCDKTFIVGGINGNLYSINPDGTWNWSYYVGSTITGMDISKDGKTLVVGTYAGMLHLLHIEYEENSMEVKQIIEEKRWIAWKNEEEVYEW